MKFFDRTGGHWLFWTGFCYLIGGLLVANSEYRAYTMHVELVWLIALSAPLWCPPFGRWLNMSVDWDKNMFGWRKKQIAEQVSKDIGNLPEPAETPAMPEVAEPAEIFDNSDATYTIGKNKAGWTQLRMKLDYGSATLTMQPEAVIELIEQLAVTIRKEYNVEVTARLIAADEEDIPEVLQ